MEMISQFASTTNIMELLRVVWMEVAMASFAALLYFTLTGWVVVQKQKPKAVKKAEPVRKPVGKACDQEPTAHQMVAKALRQGKVKNAIVLLQELPESLAGKVPANIAPRLLMAAAKSAEFSDVMSDMRVLTGKIETRSFEAVVQEATKNKDVAACRQLQAMSRLLLIPKSWLTLEALAKMLASDASCLRALLEDAETPLARPFAKAVLEACAALKDVDLAMDVFDKVAEGDAAMLRSVVENAATTATTTTSAPADPISIKGASVHSKEIRTCAKNGDLAGAVKIFEQQRKQGINPLVLNNIMDACIECGHLDKAMEYFNEYRSSGLVDVISYNTAMKGHVAQGRVDGARSLFAELSEKGLAPTLASYHILLNFYVNAGDRGSSWQLVDEMQAASVLPNTTTCSILLKKLQSPADINKVFGLVGAIRGPMDEALFQSLADTCIRTGQLALLSKYREKLSREGGSPTLTSSSYGSMIKAYGQARDVKRVVDLWADMVKNNVQPTSITLGCMVQALVSNRRTADAWKLVQEMRRDETTRPLLNTIIYSTVLKGFANAREMDKVTSLYEEMKANGSHPNNITFNTILDAFAQSGNMDRVPMIMEDMKRAVPRAEPDIVTYTTIVKGYCNSGCLDRALEVFKDMQSGGKFAADEVLYNSLLDGCAKEHRPDDALRLLGDMRKTGVSPSNFTLSMLVKLMGRCRRLNQAFTIIDDISSEYGLKVNIQVYTCLIQACFNNRQAAKAVAVHDQIIKGGLIPDEVTYSVLVKGCLQAGLIDKAVELTKCAHGLPVTLFKGALAPGLSTRSLDELVAALGGPASEAAKTLLVELAECRVSAAAPRRQAQWNSKGRTGTPASRS